MAEVKLTPEWCEERADAAERFAAAMSDGDATDAGALGFVWEADALRLAARALRVKAHLEKLRSYGCDSNEPGCDGSCGLEQIGVTLAILEGREP